MTVPQPLHPEVVDALHSVQHAPRGRDRVAAAEDALLLAQRVGGFHEEVAARLALTSALYHVPTQEASLAHFVWLRHALEDPRLTDADDRADIHWKLKWALTLMLAMPGVSLATIRTAVDDVEQAFRADGWQLRPVHAARATLARMTGDDDELGRQLTLWRTTPRDAMSDCEACEHRERAMLVRDEDPRAAIAAVADVVDGRFGCAEEPALSLALTAVCSTEVGDVDGAVAAYHAGWRLCRDDEALATAVADHLVALTRLGNVDRALDHLLPRLGWRERLDTVDVRLRFAAAAALVLDVARARGLAPERIGDLPTGELADTLGSEARDLAARLDARNGTDRNARRVAGWTDAGLVAAAPTLPPLRVAGPGAGDESVAELGTLLESQLDARDARTVTTIERWLARRDALLAEVRPEDWGHVSLLERLAARGRPSDESRRLLERSRDAALRAGDGVAALRAEAELALVPDAEGRADVAGAARVAERLRAEGHVVEAGRTWAVIGMVVDHDDALDALGRAVECFAAAGDDVALALARIDVAARTAETDPDGAAALLDLVPAETVGRSATVAVCLHETRARVEWGRGDHDAVTASLRAAAEAGTAAAPPVNALLALADLAVDEDEWGELEEYGRRLVRHATAVRRRDLLAIGQRFLGLALVETGRPVEAAELLEAALPVIREGNPHLVGPTGWALGNALAALGEEEPARTAYATAALGFEAQERLTEAGHAHLRAGNAAFEDDPLAAAVHLDTAQELAQRQGETMLYVAAAQQRAGLRAREGERADAVRALDRIEEDVRRMALETGDAVDEGYLVALRPRILRQGAHILAAGGEPALGVARLERAEAMALREAQLRLVCRAERGAMLAQAGRVEEAEELVREAAPLLGPAEPHLVAQTVGTVAQALHDRGDVEAADRLWTELVESGPA